MDALVDEEALAVTGAEVEFIGEAEFADGEGLRRRLTGDEARGFLCVLVEAFPPEGAPAGERLCFLKPCGPWDVLGLDEPVAIAGIDEDAGEGVA